MKFEVLGQHDPVVLITSNKVCWFCWTALLKIWSINIMNHCPLSYFFRARFLFTWNLISFVFEYWMPLFPSAFSLYRMILSTNFFDSCDCSGNGRVYFRCPTNCSKSYLIPFGCVFITFFLGENPHIKYSRKVTHGSFHKLKQICQRDIWMINEASKYIVLATNSIQCHNLRDTGEILKGQGVRM